MVSTSLPKLGISLFGLPVGEIARTAASADRAGFDSLWTSEFMQRSAIVPLSVMSEVTRSSVIGSGIMYGVGRSPVILASEARSLDDLTKGRFILGLGSGTRRMIADWHGEDPHSPAIRMEELVPLVKAIWLADSKPVDHEGSYYRVHVVPFPDGLPDRPRQARIYTAGVNPRMIEVAGRVADGFLGHTLFTRSYIEDVVLPALERGRQRCDRPENAVKVVTFILAGISDEELPAREDAAKMIAFYASVKSYSKLFESAGFGAEADRIREAFTRRDREAMVKSVTDRMIDEFSISGTADQVNARLSRYAGLIDELVLFPPSFGVELGRLRDNVDRLIKFCAPTARARKVE